VVGAGLTESVCRRNRLVQLRARAEKTLIRRIILIVLLFSGVLFVV
jgi:hypothetical protein